MRKALLPLILALWAAPCALARDPAPDGAAAVVVDEYIELAPSFVTNYGGPGPLHYLKADIVVRVSGERGVEAVRYHMPQLRHHLVMLLSRQTSESIATTDGKEQLRQQALTEVQEVLLKEEGASYVTDLLFNGFIVQR